MLASGIQTAGLAGLGGVELLIVIAVVVFLFRPRPTPPSASAASRRFHAPAPGEVAAWDDYRGPRG
jgi:hypothetical protein